MAIFSSYPQVTTLTGTELVLIDAGTANNYSTKTITTSNLAAAVTGVLSGTITGPLTINAPSNIPSITVTVVGSVVSQPVGFVYNNTSNNSGALTGGDLTNDAAHAFATWISSSTRGASILTGGPTGEQVMMYTNAAIPIVFGINGVAAFQLGTGGNATFLAPTTGSAVSITGTINTSQPVLANIQNLSTNAAALAGVGISNSAHAFSRYLTSTAAGASILTGGPTGEQALMYTNASVPMVIGTNGTVAMIITGAQAVQFPNVSTTASAANAFLDNANSNNLLRSTSSIKYKTDVSTIDSSESENVLSLRPVKYKSMAQADPHDVYWYGLIAEEVADVDPRLVHFTKDEHGNSVPDGVQYDRISVLTLDVVKRLSERLDRAGL